MNITQRKEIVTGVKKAANTIGTILLVFGIIGIIVGAILSVIDIGALSTVIGCIVMIVLVKPVKYLLYGYALILENSNKRTYSETIKGCPVCGTELESDACFCYKCGQTTQQ